MPSITQNPVFLFSLPAKSSPTTINGFLLQPRPDGYENFLSVLANAEAA